MHFDWDEFKSTLSCYTTHINECTEEQRRNFEKKITTVAAVLCKDTIDQYLRNKLNEARRTVENRVEVLDKIDDLLIEASRMEKERKAAAQQRAELNSQKAELTLQEKSLSSKRARLGYFVNKKKNGIDRELADIAVKQRELSENNLALYRKITKLDEQIHRNTGQRCNYKSKEELVQSIAKAKAEVVEIETQLAEKSVYYDNITYDFEEALQIYLSDPEVTEAINSILCPDVSPGSIFYGRCIQTPREIREPIEWQVLSKEDNRILVVSKYTHYDYNFGSDQMDVTWETCSLRKWLNGEFLEHVFYSEEQRRIINSTVTADKNPQYDTPPGNDTTDRVFLLSIPEAEKYFKSDRERRCRISFPFFCTNVFAERAGACWWWLRSPGKDSGSISYVHANGSVIYGGVRAGNPAFRGFAVRPAMWIDTGP